MEEGEILKVSDLANYDCSLSVTERTDIASFAIVFPQVNCNLAVIEQQDVCPSSRQ